MILSILSIRISKRIVLFQRSCTVLFLEEGKEKINYYKDDCSLIILDQFEKRIQELETYKSEAWNILQTASNLKTKLDAIGKLNDLTLNLHNLYELLPDYIGLNLEVDRNRKGCGRRQEPFEIKEGEYSKQAKF
jgi:hypothetical protein